MVSRIEFFCPGCGAPEVPELILREYYHCPNCQEDVPRSQLDRQRRNNYLLAGANQSPFTITTMGAFFVSDGGGVQTLTSPNALDVKSNDLFIACIGTQNGTPAQDPTVTLGASDSLTKATGQTADLPFGWIYTFNGTITAPGLNTLTITMPDAVQSDIVCCALKVTGHATSAIDKVKTLTDVIGDGVFSTGNTTALTLFNELAIGWVVAENSADPLAAGGLKDGFVQNQLVNTPTIVGIQASKQLNSKAAVVFRGVHTPPNAGNSASVITIKPR